MAHCQTAFSQFLLKLIGETKSWGTPGPTVMTMTGLFVEMPQFPYFSFCAVEKILFAILLIATTLITDVPSF